MPERTPHLSFGEEDLAEGIDAEVTVWRMESVTSFPRRGRFWAVVWNRTDHERPGDDRDAEIVLITRVDAARRTLTVVRGQEETLARSHRVREKRYRVRLTWTERDLRFASVDLDREYGTDPSLDDNTALLQRAIDEAAANGGAELRFGAGNYRHRGLRIPDNASGITLRGANRAATFLDLANDGDGIVCGSDADKLSIENLTLRSSVRSSGWALTCPRPVVRDVRLSHLDINGFEKGVHVGDSLCLLVENCRFNGPGKDTEGSIGLQLGDPPPGVGGNAPSVEHVYLNNYETLARDFAADSVWTQPILETADVGIQVLAGATTVISPWFGSTPSCVDSADIYLVGGSALLVGYGSQSWNLRDKGKHGNSLVVIPDRFDRATTALLEGVRFGRTMVLRDANRNRVSMARDDALEWRDQSDASGTAETSLFRSGERALKFEHDLEVGGVLRAARPRGTIYVAGGARTIGLESPDLWYPLLGLVTEGGSVETELQPAAGQIRTRSAGHYLIAVQLTFSALAGRRFAFAPAVNGSILEHRAKATVAVSGSAQSVSIVGMNRLDRGDSVGAMVRCENAASAELELTDASLSITA